MADPISDTARLRKLDAPPQGRFARINGIRLYFEEYGQGVPLLLLHGFFCSGAMWSPHIAALSRRYRLIIPDYRGHGRTENDLDEFTHRQAALDLHSLLDRLGVDHLAAMGISSGGMILLHMATQRPERIRRMALIGSTHYFPAGCRRIMAEHTQEALTPRIIADRSRVHRLGEKQIRAMQAHFNGMKDRPDDMNFTPPFLARIRAETLIIHGDRDVFFPVALPVEQYRHIPRSYLWIVPFGGHVPLDRIEGLFHEAALEFLAGGWSEDANGEHTNPEDMESS